MSGEQRTRILKMFPIIPSVPMIIVSSPVTKENYKIYGRQTLKESCFFKEKQFVVVVILEVFVSYGQFHGKWENWKKCFF